MEKSEPTPEDFERAREWAEDFAVNGNHALCNGHVLRCAAAFVEALSRMQAAERKVEAWGPIVARALVSPPCIMCRAQVAHALVCALADLPADLQPEEKP